MKALTLHQPWATLIAIGAKKYETRSWPTEYRGLMVIHAGKTLMVNPHDRGFLGLLSQVGIADVNKLPLGAGLCVVKLNHVYRTEDVAPYLSEQELAFGNYQPKRAAWELELVEVFDPPIPARGAQGLWDWQS